MGTAIERVSLTNYKSVVKCDVALRPLTVVVGRNSTGKSNFLDSLHFIADGLTGTLDYAIRKRGGARALTHRGAGPPLEISLRFRTHRGGPGAYSLSLDRGLIRREHLTVQNAVGDTVAEYERSAKGIEVSIEGSFLASPPSMVRDRLALVALSGFQGFREAFDILSGMRFYRLNPELMREVHDPDDGDVLQSDGSNISSVWGRLEQLNPSLRVRLTEYLAVMVPSLSRVHRVMLGGKETLHFHQSRKSKRSLMFHASSMSDGALRALGALVAAQQASWATVPISVVGIEEPETALHPGAVAALMDAFREASPATQVIVTSHSPDVLDHVDMANDGVLVTEIRDGATTIAEVDTASREAIRRNLYSPGDLLRMDQLQPSA